MYDPIKNIKNTTDKEFLKELLDKYIPSDEELVASRRNLLLYEIEAKSRGLNVDDVIAEKIKGIEIIKDIVTKRLNELQNR
jgi:archaellum component FlaC